MCTCEYVAVWISGPGVVRLGSSGRVQGFKVKQSIASILGANAALLGSDRPVLVLFSISERREQSRASTHTHMQRKSDTSKVRN